MMPAITEEELSRIEKHKPQMAATYRMCLRDGKHPENVTELENRMLVWVRPTQPIETERDMEIPRDVIRWRWGPWLRGEVHLTARMMLRDAQLAGLPFQSCRIARWSHDAGRVCFHLKLSELPLSMHRGTGLGFEAIAAMLGQMKMEYIDSL